MSTVVRTVARSRLGADAGITIPGVSVTAPIVAPSSPAPSTGVAPVTTVTTPAAVAPFSIPTPAECTDPLYRWAGQIKPIGGSTTLSPRTMVIYGGIVPTPGIFAARDRIVSEWTRLISRTDVPTTGGARRLTIRRLGVHDPNIVWGVVETPDAPMNGATLLNFLQSQAGRATSVAGFGRPVGNAVVPSAEIVASPVMWNELGVIVASATTDALTAIGAVLVSTITMPHRAVSAVASLEYRIGLLNRGAETVRNAQSIADSAVGIAQTAPALERSGSPEAMTRIRQAYAMLEDAGATIDAAAMARAWPPASSVDVPALLQRDLDAGLAKHRGTHRGAIATRCAMIKMAQGMLSNLTARKAAAVAAEPAALAAWDAQSPNMERAFEILEAAWERVASIEESLFEKGSILTRKVGPLPVWAWMTGAAAVPAGVYMKMRGMF